MFNNLPDLSFLVYLAMIGFAAIAVALMALGGWTIYHLYGAFSLYLWG